MLVIAMFAPQAVEDGSMAADHSFSQFLDALQSHDDSVAQNEIWQRCWSRLVCVLSNRLNRKFSTVADEEDVALSAIHSIFDGIASKRFPRLGDRESFWNLLLTVAYRKLIKQYKRETRLKRGGGAVLIDAARGGEANESHVATQRLDARRPTEAQLVIEAEELVERIRDPVLQKIVLLWLEGYTDKEVAERLGVAVKTISRRRERIKAM